MTYPILPDMILQVSDEPSGGIHMKVMAHLRHDLWFSHSIGCFHGEDASVALVLLEALFQLTLGFAGPKNVDGIGITKCQDDLIVVARELTRMFPLARIIGLGLLSSGRATGGIIGASWLAFYIRLNVCDLFAGLQQHDDNGLSVVYPQACMCFHVRFLGLSEPSRFW